MKLYCNPLSPNSRRASLTARQADVAFDEVVLDFGKGEHKAPEFLAINPNGMVPALVDEDLELFESRAMMQHIALKNPASGLFPSDDRVRTEIARWQFWDASHFARALGDLAFEKLLKPMMGIGEPDPAKVDDALERFARYAAVLNTHLDGRAWLAGDALTIADLTIAASMTYAAPCQVPVADHPHLAAWFGRVQELDAWKATQPKMG